MNEKDNGWLSTRNKSKVESKPKPLRCRSSLPTKSKQPRQLGEFVLTQSPPPEQLFKATKQSCLTNFFKPKEKYIELETINLDEPECVITTSNEPNCDETFDTVFDAELGLDDNHDRHSKESGKEYQHNGHNFEIESDMKQIPKLSKKRKLSKTKDPLQDKEKSITDYGVKVAGIKSALEYSPVKKSKRYRIGPFENTTKITHDEEHTESVIQRTNTNKRKIQNKDEDLLESETVIFNKRKADNVEGKISIEKKAQNVNEFISEHSFLENIPLKQSYSPKRCNSSQLENKRTDRDCDSFTLESQSINLESLQFESQIIEEENVNIELESLHTNADNNRLHFQSKKDEKEYDSLQLDTQNVNYKPDNLLFDSKKVTRDNDSLQLQSQFTFQSQREYYDALERDLAQGSIDEDSS